jgi:hypothetical protein
MHLFFMAYGSIKHEDEEEEERQRGVHGVRVSISEHNTTHAQNSTLLGFLHIIQFFIKGS